MDGIFCKLVSCCSSILKQPRQGIIRGAFCYFIVCVATSVAAYVCADSCRELTLVPCSTGYAGDYIISSVNCGIFLGAVVCFLFGVYKPVTAPPASDLARSTRNAGDNIVARTSDGSENSNVVASDAAICSGVQTGWSWRTRLIFAWRWTDTFELDCSALGQPIGPVTEHVSWEGCLGQPMKQPDNATCALVACTVAVEAMNRFVYALLHGEGVPFPWAAAEPLELLEICKVSGIWDRCTGAFVHAVLGVISEWGGVPLANPSSDARTVLPLSCWQKYTGAQLTQEGVAKLLYGGPCVGTLWVCPWYHLFDASRNDTWVYRGCGQSQDNRAKSKRRYGKRVSSHAVVCLGYRCCGDQMHVLVLDNHKDTGPRRWVDVREIDALYTLTVT